MTHPLTRYGFDPRQVKASGYGSLGVMIVGEAPGEQEADSGVPFCEWAPAGSVLERAIRRCGFNRSQFAVTNTVPFRPPKNYLDGAPWEEEAVAYGLESLDADVARFKPRCMVALGGIATRALTGMSGPKMGVSQLSGFVMPGVRYDVPVIPCFHPAFLRRGAMSHLGVMMRCLKLAAEVAKTGAKAKVPDPDRPPAYYNLHPSEEEAIAFYMAAELRAGYIAYDIETPYSTEEDAAEEAEGVHTIKSIQFSIAAGGGIFMPWRQPYIDLAKRVLALPNPKLGWNNWRFDDPVLRANGCEIKGDRHDLMWTWHHSQPDLPRGLQFAAAQMGWPWPWKHLDAAEPQFYGIVDVDVLQWMVTNVV